MVELSEDEMKNFGKVWASILVSLSYCYTVGKLTPKGFTRLFAILPIVALFLALPLNLTSFHFGGMISFFIAWLANFKLLLFSFDKGPLCSNPSISFPTFLALACLPIKIQNDPPLKTSIKSENNQDPDHKTQNKIYPSSQNSKIPPKKSPWNYIIKASLLALIIHIHQYSNHIHPKIIWLIYLFHMYFTLEIVLALVATAVKFNLGFELEPQFKEPLLSTSLQDFWGRRWNLMASRILRPTAYFPALNLSTKIVGRRWARVPAVMATFMVSALMHELIFYYLGRLSPTFEVTWFFLLHGFCLCVEIAVKEYVGGRWRLPWWISGPATVSFVVGTGFWLFLPPLIRAGLDTRPFEKYAAFGAFVSRLRRALEWRF